MSFEKIKGKLSELSSGLDDEQLKQLKEIMDAAEAGIRNPAYGGGQNAPQTKPLDDSFGKSTSVHDALGDHEKPMSVHDTLGDHEKPMSVHDTLGDHEKPMSVHDTLGDHEKPMSVHDTLGDHEKPMSVHDTLGDHEKPLEHTDHEPPPPLHSHDNN